jgi:glucan biosynthesis protein C
LKLLVLFRERFNRDGPLSSSLSKSAYTAYIIHPFFVVVGTFLLIPLPVDPLIKFLLLCPLAVASCFLVSDWIRRAPVLRRVL